MNMYEIAQRGKTSIAVLKRLAALGVLKYDKEAPAAETFADRVRFHLNRNPRLTVGMVLELLDNPAALGELRGYEDRASRQIAALGDVANEGAPAEVTAAIDDAARGDLEAGRILAAWIRRVLPARDVPHVWLASRLLYPLPANLRNADASRLTFALMHVRRRDDMAGWWHSGKNKEIVYHEFRTSALDL